MQYDAVIIGGGLTGLQTAISLGKHGLSVAVIDRASVKDIVDADFDGRTCAIAYASANLMKKSGVWDAIKPHACPMLNIDIEDGDLIKVNPHCQCIMIVHWSGASLWDTLLQITSYVQNNTKPYKTLMA